MYYKKWWYPNQGEWRLIAIDWTDFIVEETWVSAWGSKAWKKCWNPVQNEWKLVSILWTEYTVQETWSKGVAITIRSP